MFIIKWVNPKKKQIYYTYTRTLIGARCDVAPFICEYYIGYINYHGHEIIDINFIINNKVWCYEDYRNEICFGNKKIKNIILDNIIDFLIKLNKH